MELLELTATSSDAMSDVTSSHLAELLGSIDYKLELFLLLFVMFECIKMVRYGFNKLYKGKGV